MFVLCAVLFTGVVLGLAIAFRRLGARVELDRADRLLADEIDALGRAYDEEASRSEN